MTFDVAQHGIKTNRTVSANRSPAELIEAAIRREEGMLSHTGAFSALTGERTARSPEDKYIVRDSLTTSTVNWGKVNKPLESGHFAELWSKALEYASTQELFVQDAVACADPKHRITLRVIAQQAWQALFARCLFLLPTAKELSSFKPEWVILAVPDLNFVPTVDGTRTNAVIAVDFTKKQILIAGTHYAGEIKKSIFTILNFLLPLKGVLSMHCSANVGAHGDVALFFGLSGTGKTTLSADPERRLIGDDEHGWSDDGVFNIEGGCYAKTIKLSAQNEPQIYNAIRFGSVLENVPLDPETRIPDYDSLKYTENTRCGYPIDFIPNIQPGQRGGHPTNIFFLTCDAFGILPPLSRLSPEQAMDYFLCGYTAKIAGTEIGVKEPTVAFSSCFGAPFLPLPPRKYADLLKDRLQKYNVPVWLLNTGWSGGGYGVGKRLDLPHTRALLHAALDGKLQDIPFRTDRFFGISVPTVCPGVPSNLLDPQLAWKDSAAYERGARQLADLFAQTLAQQ